jgi:hypothetical protein
MVVEQKPGCGSDGGRQAQGDDVGGRQQRRSFHAGYNRQGPIACPLDLGVGRAEALVEHMLEPGSDEVAADDEPACRELASQRDDAGPGDQGSVEIEHGEADDRGAELCVSLVPGLVPWSHRHCSERRRRTGRRGCSPRPWAGVSMQA